MVNWRSFKLFLYEYQNGNLLDTARPLILTMIVAQNLNEKRIYFLTDVHYLMWYTAG